MTPPRGRAECTFVSAPALDLAPRDISGACECCGRPFTWTAKGGRGRPRLHCSEACATLLHDLERLSRAVEAWRVASGAVPGSVDAVANDVAALAAALRSKAPKKAPRVKGQLALLAPVAAPRGVK